MNVDRIVHIFAGSMIMISLALGHWVSPWWFLLTLFVGVNLFQSGITNWCLMSRILAKAGVPTQGSCGL
ncbi:DUF2892 domain-containing protein [Geothrix sp. 21YS21S-2]|uniref:YgaP family membrane protein n=1 Tax=Geothrix sp. 21YS21S-2 TaxID=3068893 RepID=UPI0027B883DB|nr:DUF2892 domain-containing protein [Geothrix sp. 21YS21S-2]